MKILLIDNYDSFTYNLVHYLEGLDVEVTVVLNDQINLDELDRYDKIVISPGPGLPKDAGIIMEVIDIYHKTKPILGVCLGFQALSTYFGGELYNQDEVMHGIQATCKANSQSVLFQNTSSTIKVGLYHSWALKPETTPACFRITGISDTQVIMAIEHKTLPLYGVQFHPESILTEFGMQILKNFLAD
ncbi:MAG: aminodeoxychorismate/anthranilate synthase component II [Crocinitomicaceae bacterium]